MELTKATAKDCAKIMSALRKKDIQFCTPEHILNDYVNDFLYAVKEGDKVLATVSLVPEEDYGYTAVKRMCILNKKNQGKGIAHFALREVQKRVIGRIGVTPWADNASVRHLLEIEGFVLQYVFNERWCYYAKG